ncbi:MAG TPA: undecaprenyl-diphosphate phosphatase [Actinomycetes bacterium]|nr:undecaprenyl-diphosphate phosphatase [Actinomycetes bacterium]
MLRALVLGIVQGLTEFLPISSSAHLSIVPRLLGYPPPELSFEVLLHFGTLTAVVAYFWRDLGEFALSLLAPGRMEPLRARQRRRLLLLLVLASVPAAVAGFAVQDWAEEQTQRPLRAAVFVVATTALMITAELYDRRRNRLAAGRAPAVAAAGGGRAGTIDPDPADRAPEGGPARPQLAEQELETLPPGPALGIGVAQACALVPGVSRSGATISAGLLLGVSREAAARFSFLLSIPAILGAGVLKLDELGTGTESAGELAVGFLAAAVSGFLAVSLLLRVLRTRTLWPFITYRLIAGTLFVVLLSTVRG